MRSITKRTRRALRKSVWFVVFKHKYAFWFAIGVTLFAALMTFIGIPVMVAHQAALAGLVATLKSHSQWLILLHIFLISAIYIGLDLFIEHACLGEEFSDDKKKEAVRFLNIFIAILIFVFLAGHF